MNTENSLLVVGNPLLDLIADVSLDFLEKWKLLPNNAILADSSHSSLYTDLISTFKVEYVAGGAAQNSARGAQWMLPPKSTCYFGCVGKDKYAQLMQQAASSDGLSTFYMQDDSTPTGTCAVLITGKHRSLVANLAAANNFKVDHVQSHWDIVKQARFYYISGFFLTVSPTSILKIASHAAEENKTFVMNLSAPFLCQFFKDQMLQCLPYVDVLFGNESEAVAFAENNGYENTKDIAEIALKLANHDKVNSNRSRMVIITQGADPTIVAYKGKITSHAVIPIKEEDIIDTNGAGDAFVGGFLSQLVQEKSLASCLDAGNYLANIVIQRSGASYPETKPEKLPSF